MPEQPNQQPSGPSVRRVGNQYAMVDMPITHVSLERKAFVEGMMDELQNLIRRYKSVVEELAKKQAQLDILERNVAATRDHLFTSLEHAEDAVPANWRQVLMTVRFINVRLGDAVVELLRAESPLSTDDLMRRLDNGNYRWRTGTPLRELNAAMLRNQQVKRDGDLWHFKPTKDRRQPSQMERVREEVLSATN